MGLAVRVVIGDLSQRNPVLGTEARQQGVNSGIGSELKTNSKRANL